MEEPRLIDEWQRHLIIYSLDTDQTFCRYFYCMPSMKYNTG